MVGGVEEKDDSVVKGGLVGINSFSIIVNFI